MNTKIGPDEHGANLRRCRPALEAMTIAALISATAAAAPVRKRTPPRPTHTPSAPVVTPAAYANSIDGIDCSNVVEHRHSIARIVSLLPPAAKAMISTEKDEFETNEAYAQRAGVIYRGVFGNTDKIIFAGTIDDWHVHYAADSQILKLTSVFKRTSDDAMADTTSELAFTMLKNSTDTGSFIGANAYGSKARVSTYRDFEVQLQVPRRQLLSSPFNFLDADFEFPADPNDARLFKLAPIVLIVATLRYPFGEQRTRYRSATIDNLIQSETHYYGIKANLQCVIFMAGEKEIGRREQRVDSKMKGSKN